MIVVTGAKGIIGRAVSSRLSAAGIPVSLISRDIFDLSSGQDLLSFVKEKPAAVIHLAAAVPHSSRYPDTDVSAELTRRIDHCVYDAARMWNCRVIYASGCSLYDKYSSDTKYEDTPVLLRSSSPYLMAKNDGEKLFGMLPSFAVMRVSAPLGPGLPSSVVAMRFLELARMGKKICLWGTGKREQDYVDVNDIANAMIKASFAEANGIFNIASNKPTPMLELANVIVKVLRQGSIEFSDRLDPLEGEYARYSNAKALEIFGWMPQQPIEESIRSICEAL